MSHEDEVDVEFDDGDSGRIPLSQVRLLPHDYPVTGMKYERFFPLLFPGFYLSLNICSYFSLFFTFFLSIFLLFPGFYFFLSYFFLLFPGFDDFID